MATTSRSFVNDTVADELHVPFVIVQRNTAVVPAGTPVTVDVGEDGVVIVAVPLTSVHKPVPGEGLFPARVNDPVLHKVWFGPALATTS